MQMLEAFRALNALNEDIFSLDAEGVGKLSDFTQNDDLEDDVQIIDPEAETEDDLQDNYIGKVILDCCVCHSKLYKDPAEVDVDETGELANVGEECPYCFTPDGFKVIGEVAAFNSTSETEEAEVEEDDTIETDSTKVEDQSEDEVDEKLDEGLIGDINVPITANVDASGSSVGFLGGTAGDIANEDLEEPIEEGIFGFKTKKEKAAEEKARREAEAKKRADKEAAEEREYARQQAAADSWSRHDQNKREAERQYNRNRYNSIKGDNPSNTGYRGVNYSGGDYYESLEEDIQDLSMTANDTHIEVSEEDNGKVTVSMEPATNEAGREMITPVSPEAEAEIMADEVIEEPTAEEPVEDVPEEGADSEVDADFDEFDEESMDGLGESYFKRVYENVNSFKTTAVKTSGNSMIIEGLLEFNSGNKKNTSFVFEALDATKSGKYRFVGDNKELTEGKKAFMLTGTISNNKLIVESMNYNYKHIDAEGKTSRVYGTERLNKGE